MKEDDMERDHSICKPFLRWAGGKKWLIPYVFELTKNIKVNHYHEPFLGGGSVFFALQTRKKSYLSDINEELIKTYIQVRDNPEALIERLSLYENTEECYYKTREEKPTSEIEIAARFIFLNKTSYNGLYRVNRNGEYNVPYGHRKVVDICPTQILAASNKLHKTSIKCGTFDINKYIIKQNDLFFLDPPYAVSTDQNSFIGYNADLFSIEKQHELKEFVDYIEKKGAFFILTNAYHKTIKDIFETGNIRCVDMSRNSLIGGRDAKRGKVSEYLFTNIRGVKDEFN